MVSKALSFDDKIEQLRLAAASFRTAEELQRFEVQVESGDVIGVQKSPLDDNLFVSVRRNSAELSPEQIALGHEALLRLTCDSRFSAGYIGSENSEGDLVLSTEASPEIVADPEWFEGLCDRLSDTYRQLWPDKFASGSEIDPTTEVVNPWEVASSWIRL